MKKYGQKEYVLGVMVSARFVHASLLKLGPDGPEALRYFRRQRNARQAELEVGASPLYEGETDDDFSLEFGEATTPNASDLFLGSEFSGLEAPSAPSGPEPMHGEMEEFAMPFDFELKDILAECADAGYPDPPVAFCLPNTDMGVVEMNILPNQKGKKKASGDDEAKGKKKEKAKAKEKGAEKEKGQNALIAQLKELHEGPVHPERVAFLEMTPNEEGLRRVLGLVARPDDALTSTLTMYHDRNLPLPPVELLDAEVSLYLGIARASFHLMSGTEEADDPADALDLDWNTGPRKTLIVRAGVEDTLVMFLKDQTLQHYESLRSITTYDASETICSRVLLLQDEYGVGDIQHVLLLGEEREADLVNSFRLFFPDTRVESLRTYVPRREITETDENETVSVVMASLVALRLIPDDLYETVFEPINLLPKKLLKRRRKVPISWPVAALYVLLFSTVLFFMGRYFDQQHAIDLYAYQLQKYPADIIEQETQVLQMRIDSLQKVYTGYTNALNVLDTLLIGSDRWSRSLEKTSKMTAAVGGVWIDKWKPQGFMIEVRGSATSRDQVVSLAERMNGAIESLTFSEIRDWPVFSYRMSIPLQNELPEAARYLRERAEGTVANPASDDADAAPAALSASPASAPALTPAPVSPPVVNASAVLPDSTSQGKPPGTQPKAHPD